eukprot:8088-Heterococcus_DN1.PRE.2
MGMHCMYACVILINDESTWTTTACDEDERSCKSTALSLRIVADAFRRSSTPTPTGIFDEFYSQAGIRAPQQRQRSRRGLQYCTAYRTSSRSHQLKRERRDEKEEGSKGACRNQELAVTLGNL